MELEMASSSSSSPQSSLTLTSTSPTPWHSPDGWATQLFAPNPITIFATFSIAIILPILLHLWLYRAKANPKQPGFLLLGLSNSGKTSLLAALENFSLNSPVPSTCPSQKCITAQVLIPSTYTTHSDRLRSENDTSVHTKTAVRVVDTPGDRRLRSTAVTKLVSALGIPQLTAKSNHVATGIAAPTSATAGVHNDTWPATTSLHGIVFVVDAADMTPGSIPAQQAAEYLYDILLLLQQRQINPRASSSHGRTNPAVLIVGNKSDVFTAQTPSMLRSILEKEIQKVRTSRRHVVGGAATGPLLVPGARSGVGNIKTGGMDGGSGGGGEGFSANIGSEDPFLSFLNLGNVKNVASLLDDGEVPFLGDERKDFRLDSLSTLADLSVEVHSGCSREGGDLDRVWKWLAQRV